MPERVKVYSTRSCPICEKTKACLTKWNIKYQELRVDTDSGALKEMLEICNNAQTVPQIVIDGKCIGGFSELTELHMDGQLDQFVQQQGN